MYIVTIHIHICRIRAMTTFVVKNQLSTRARTFASFCLHISIYTHREMGKRGWNLFTSRNPTCISVCIGEQHTNARLLAAWLDDLRESAAACREASQTKQRDSANAAEGEAAEQQTQVCIYICST